MVDLQGQSLSPFANTLSQEDNDRIVEIFDFKRVRFLEI